MGQQRRFGVGLLVLTVCIALTGCAQNRQVLSPVGREMLDDPTAPAWAQMNGQPPSNGQMFFVGVSEEQVLSESEAIHEAYMDAVQRVADAIGVEITGSGDFEGDQSTDAASKWPHQASKHVKGHGFGLGGIIPFAATTGDNWLGIGVAGVGGGRLRKPHFNSVASGDYESDREARLKRNQIIARVNIVDTWTVVERFQHPWQLNDMKYGELWKAKVLVSCPSDFIAEESGKQFDRMNRIAELPVRREEDSYELDVQERLSLLERRNRQCEDLHAHRMAELQKELEYKEQAGKAFLEPLPEPTFSFMNKTLWHGHYIQRRGAPFVADYRYVGPELQRYPERKDTYWYNYGGVTRGAPLVGDQGCVILEIDDD